VVEFYNQRFNLGFTDQQKSDLVEFLRTHQEATWRTWRDATTDTYASTAKAALDGFAALIADASAGRQIHGRSKNGGQHLRSADCRPARANRCGV
jgi:hypothetical protein